MTLHAEAPAKVNLGLRVLGRAATPGLHRISSLAQAIDWQDDLQAEISDEDRLEVVGASLPSGIENLVWKAINLYREASEKVVRLRLRLVKRIPTAAGLGGGSSDAAAALLIARRVGGGEVEPAELAPTVGADVSFCLVGGTAIVNGSGEVVDPVDPPPAGYRLVLAVPPVELSAAAVYRAWDESGGPVDVGFSGTSLPPSLREHAPLGNDLYPAAVALHPLLDEWRAELQTRWGRPVFMSGSGPTLFGYFLDEDEAEEALGQVPAGLRAATTAAPTAHGARIVDR